MIAIDGLSGGLDSCFAELQDKILRAGDTAESDRFGWHIFSRNSTAHSPDQLSIHREKIGSGTGREDEGVGALKCSQRFAQAAGWQEMIKSIVRSDEDDVEVSCTRVVHESILQYVKILS